jgi:hypothetical protein
VNDELERIWKEADVAKFKVTSRHLPGGTEENHKIHPLGYPASGLKFEPGTTRGWVL